MKIRESCNGNLRIIVVITLYSLGKMIYHTSILHPCESSVILHRLFFMLDQAVAVFLSRESVSIFPP